MVALHAYNYRPFVLCSGRLKATHARLIKVEPLPVSHPADDETFRYTLPPMIVKTIRNSYQLAERNYAKNYDELPSACL